MRLSGSIQGISQEQLRFSIIAAHLRTWGHVHSQEPFLSVQSRMLVQVSLRRAQVYELHPQKKGGSTPKRHTGSGLERVAGEGRGMRAGAGEVGWLWRNPVAGRSRPELVWGAAGFLSETHAGHAGVQEAGWDHLVPLSAADHVPDLSVELHDLCADLWHILVRANKGKSASLAQSLVAEVDVEESLDLILWAATENVIWPH